MDILKALKIPLRNREKFPKFELIGLVPILNFATIGYALESTNRRTKLLGLLPSWNIKEMWKTGAKATIVIITYLTIAGILSTIFDFFYLNTLIILATIYMIPKAILDTKEGLKHAFTNPIKTVWNTNYFTALLQGTIAKIIVFIPTILVMYLAAMTANETILDVALYLLIPAYFYYGAIPFFILVSEAEN